MQIKLKGKTSEAIHDLDTLSKEIRSAIADALEKSAIRVKAQAKMLAPVDTGNLRNSIDYSMDSFRTAHVGSNVEYSAHQEYGTRFTKAQPYLHPALDENKDYIRTTFERELEQAVRRS